MLILGIESSCDDTSVAFVDCSERGFFVVSEKTARQIEVHKKYGGVVPEIAGRMHAENIVPVIEVVMRHENIKTLKHKNKPDVIAVTAGPGLITGLVVGVEAAKTLAYLWETPLVAVNHIAGHAHSAEIRNSKFEIRKKSKIENLKSKIYYPAVALIVSGGHTELLLMTDPTTFELIGKTRDDAAGEAFDKVGKLLGFDYPGGPKISKFAENGDPTAIKFPRPMLDNDNFEFSFAGLKTSTLYWLQDNPLIAAHVNPSQLPAGVFGVRPEGATINDLCASFEQAIIEVLVTKTIWAAKKYNPKTIILGGGVSANKKLRETLAQSIHSLMPNSLFLIPDLKYAMDNGAMIAAAGYYKAAKGEYTYWREMQAEPNWEVYAH